MQRNTGQTFVCEAVVRREESLGGSLEWRSSEHSPKLVGHILAATSTEKRSSAGWNDGCTLYSVEKDALIRHFSNEIKAPERNK